MICTVKKSRDESNDHFTCFFESGAVNNRDWSSFAVIGGNDWDKDREKGKSSGSA